MSRSLNAPLVALYYDWVMRGPGVWVRPVIWAILALAPAGIIRAGADFLGAAACAECHPDHYRKQIKSRHATALRPIGRTQLPGLLAGRPLRETGGASFAYQPVDDGLRVTVQIGQETISAALEWAFGAGAQGMTAVGRIDGRYFEHRVSYYREPARGALTVGHPVESSSNPRAALGVIQPVGEIQRCFNCHATGVREGPSGPDLSGMRPGVECERCHGPGADHVAAARAGRPKSDFAKTILNPSRFGAAAVVQICAQCHRQTADLDDPLTVRFQPVGLMASKCFRTSKSFSCLTCHDPHEDARPRTDSFYSAQCRTCHGDAARINRKCKGSRSAADCVSCHMPRSSPAPFLSFTDHRIQ